MKKSRLFILTLSMAVLSLTSTHASSLNPDFNKEINKLLQGIEIESEEDILANVLITFNKNNEIIVLSVESESEFIGTLIKNRLNYKKVNTVLDNSVKEYKLPVRIKV